MDSQCCASDKRIDKRALDSLFAIGLVIFENFPQRIFMRTGMCFCGQSIFFGNVKCLTCGRQVGRCEQCGELTSFGKVSSNCDTCGVAPLTPCVNAASSVCNSYVTTPGIQCRLCSFTEVCPDLNNPENKRRWIDLELAKRRLLIQLRELGLPPFQVNSPEDLPLKFHFLEDRVGKDGTITHFYTGHENGVITINVVEADSVEREQTRISLREPLRTLIGHMRHEAGHYFDYSLASRKFGNEYVQIFGDPASSDYETAKNRYYELGPATDWKATFVSPYASMHPWEDFAETSRCYLELMALLTTAIDQGAMTTNDLDSIEAIVNLGLQTAVRASEYSRDLGLPVLLHQQFSAAVIKKLGFIHNLRQFANVPVAA